MRLEPLRFDGGTLRLLDQRALPEREVWLTCTSAGEVAAAIRAMVVRGAPLIGAAAAFGAALGGGTEEALALLAAARPTARDLFAALEFARRARDAGEDLFAAARRYYGAVITSSEAIGRSGLPLIPEGARVLTHCNAGALAAGGIGTALAPVYLAHESGRSVSVVVGETRPWLQGARLTAWELCRAGVPCTLIADNAAGRLMQTGEVDLAIVGADRVAANGDVVNKVGTYEKSVVARDCGVPFYVALPATTLDLGLSTGEGCPIEERDPEEVLSVAGQRVAPPGIAARNPVFDVTPARLVTGYITDAGYFPASRRGEMAAALGARGR